VKRATHSQFSRHFALRLRRYVLALAAICIFATMPALTEPSKPRAGEAPVRIEIRARPIAALDNHDESKRRFGMLEFRGGLQLTSPYKEFGGISAIRVAPDGAHFIALSDKGRWLRGRIVYAGSRPTGIADAEMAPMLDAEGKPLASRKWYDTESIAEDGDTLYVGIERVNRIVKFDYGKHGLAARGVPVPVPEGVRTLPSNLGLEALVVVPKGMPLAGTLIAISERGLDSAGNIKSFLIGGPSPGEFTVKRTDEFDISDSAITRGEDLLLLERRFSWARGLGIRIRRIALNAVRPGAVADGPVLFFADFGQQVDNMEGLSVHQTAKGETVLTLISDDNFSAIQRTLLLQFTLVGE
jgi:hypothetical protein